jgi:hypothetical protein
MDRERRSGRQRPLETRVGITLIERSLKVIGGSASLEFERTGLRCIIHLPLALRPNPA